MEMGFVFVIVIFICCHLQFKFNCILTCTPKNCQICPGSFFYFFLLLKSDRTEDIYAVCFVSDGPYPYTLKLCFSTAQHANWSLPLDFSQLPTAPPIDTTHTHTHTHTSLPTHVSFLCSLELSFFFSMQLAGWQGMRDTDTEEDILLKKEEEMLLYQYFF